MSGKSKNVRNFFTELSIDRSTTDDRKFETSGTITTVDSGFISAGNLSESEVKLTSSENHVKSNNFAKAKEEEMLVDSGVIVSLAADVSKMDLENTNMNNLGRTRTEKLETKPLNSDVPWKIYYQQDEDGATQLHLAIIQKYHEAILTIIRNAPHPCLLDIPDDEAITPLHLAVLMGQWRVARWLIVAGANPGCRNLRGESPVHVAARVGDLLCCKALVDPVQRYERDAMKLKYHCLNFNSRFDLDQWDYEGQTCIHTAALHGHVDVLRLLAWYGANVNAKEGKNGYTVLHFAVIRQDDRLIRYLLTECIGLNIKAMTYAGRSALQLGFPIGTDLLQELSLRGAASPYSSDEEFNDESEDEFETYVTPKPFLHSLVGANA